jgi:hypothetical protein
MPSRPANQSFNPSAWFCGIGSFVALILFLVPPCWAQAGNVSDFTSTPVPGVGHDYIKSFVETVNPAMGSVSLRIEAPQPKVRGALNYPLYVFSYDSNGVHIPKPPNVYSPDSNKWATTFLAGDILQGAATSGSGYLPLSQTTIPPGGYYTYKFASLNGGTNNYSNIYCQYTYDYLYTEPNGAKHPLRVLSIMDQGTPVDTNGCLYFQVPFGSTVQNGGDGIYQAYVASATTGGNSGCSGFCKPAVTDAHGSSLDVEDTNGNLSNRFLTITAESSPYTPSNWGDDPNGNPLPQNVMASVAVSGMENAYKFTYSTASSSFTLNSTVLSGSTAGCPKLPGDSETQLVITAITLPNGQSYQFQYDPVYGLLSKIIYPTGATVTYTWASISGSQSFSWWQSGTYGFTCGLQLDWP